MITVTEAQILKLFPKAKDVKNLVSAMNRHFPKYEINTESRVEDFITQCGHESMGMTKFEEDLHYKAATLLRFPKYFNVSNVNKYAMDPQRIANRMYASRMGNGSEDSGDGWLYRGKGLIQITGHDNHLGFAKHIGKDVKAAAQYMLATEGAVESACWFWMTNKLNQAADAHDVVKETHIINGGEIGLKERLALDKIVDKVIV